MIGYLCKSLRIISLVWPTRLIFLAMGEVLSFRFNNVVLDPSDKRGNDTYCIVAIEDKKMGFISYCLSLSLYIMSSCLMRYSVLINLIRREVSIEALSKWSNSSSCRIISVHLSQT